MNLSEQSRAISESQQQVAREAILWLSWLRARLDSLGAAWADRRKRAREIRELYRFNERELWDLGLRRSDQAAIANGTYRRE